MSMKTLVKLQVMNQEEVGGAGPGVPWSSSGDLPRPIT